MKALQKGAGVHQEVDGVAVRHAGPSEGTGSDQEISHGFSATPKRLELIPLEAGVVFTSFSVEATHFHVTVTSGKDWGWVAEAW